MDIKEYITCKKEIQNRLICFLDNDEPDFADYLEKLVEYLKNQNIKEDENEFRAFLSLLLYIYYNHHRTIYFFKKIDGILLCFQDELKTYFTNIELYDFFKDSKRILLHLLENNIIIINESIVHDILTKRNESFKFYLYPEIKHLIDENEREIIEKKLISNDQNNYEYFNEKRHIGENDLFICKLIREDSIDEFIVYMNKTNFSLQSKIKPSIFETNYFLEINEPTLIEYAAFYGSNQIFMYLNMNGVELCSSLWHYAIHSKNAETIHQLEQLHVNPPKNSYEQCIMTAVKCHHNEIVEYITNSYFNEPSPLIINASIFVYNYFYFPYELIPCLFVDFISKDYYFIVKKIIEQKLVNINEIFSHISNSSYYYACSPLYDAIFDNKYNIVDLLLKQNQLDINLNAFMYKINNIEMIYNAFSIAVINNNIKMVNLIITIRKPDINFRIFSKIKRDNECIEYKEIGPIIYAINNKNIDIIKLFLTYPEFDVNIGNKYYLSNSIVSNYVAYLSSPLHEAVNKGYSDIVELLLSNKRININDRLINRTNNMDLEETPLYIAIKNQNIKIIKILLSNPMINVNKKSICIFNDIQYNETPLYFAIRENNLEIIEMLINHPSINVNKKSIITTKTSTTKEILHETALQLAIKTKNKKVVQLLLDDPNINVNKKTIIHKTKNNTNNLYKPEIIKDTAINIALYDDDDDIEIISMLLSTKNLNINAKGTSFIGLYKYEWNPLTISIYKKRNDIIKLLLSSYKNIDVNTEMTISDENSIIKKSPLYMAIENDCEELVQSLLSHSEINLNYISLQNLYSQNEIKEIPIINFAFEKRNKKIIKLLLSSPRIEINSKTIHRITRQDEITINEESTLICAIKFGDTEIFKLILSNPSIDIFMISHYQVIHEKDVISEDKLITKIAVLEKKSEILKQLLDYSNKKNYYFYEIKNFINITDDQTLKDIIIDYINKHKKSDD